MNRQDAEGAKKKDCMEPPRRQDAKNTLAKLRRMLELIKRENVDSGMRRNDEAGANRRLLQKDFLGVLASGELSASRLQASQSIVHVIREAWF